MTEVNEILAEREKTHGRFSDHARITQRLKLAMVESPNWDALVYTQKEALEMVAHKIGRILAGNPYFRDSWDDCIGYLTLVTREMEG